MNKTTVELVKQYIIETTKRPITPHAYETLSYLMREDRVMASHLCDVFDKLTRNGNMYEIYDESEFNETQDTE